MKMKRIDNLFYVGYGNSLDLSSLRQIRRSQDNAISFVSRTTQNNGISAIVEKIAGEVSQPSGTISVAVGGSVMESFLQFEPYYTGFHVLVLSAKTPMSDVQKLFYCACIRANKYRYNYGRQANKTLRGILVPDISEIPEYANNSKLPDYSEIIKPVSRKHIKLAFKKHDTRWEYFDYDRIFVIKKGYYNKKPENNVKGTIPFLGATEKNNGITEYYSLNDISLYDKVGTTEYDELSKKIFDGNCIAVTNNGSVACAYYQEEPFTCSHDINPLYLKNHVLNKYIAMFLITLIEQEKFRWGYGRKWRPKRMPFSRIKLPVNDVGEPDFEYMERYIKSLPYSASI